MKRKEDKRNLNTKKVLANTFKELSKQKPVNKISINDITKASHLNRNTFYYHFEDIYDLIKWILNEEVKPIIDSLNEVNLEEFLNNIFDYIEQNKHLLSSAYNPFSREQLKQILSPYFYSALNRLITKHVEQSHLYIDEGFKNFLIHFYSEGFAETMINYFKEEQTLDKKTQIKYLLALNEIFVTAEALYKNSQNFSNK